MLNNKKLVTSTVYTIWYNCIWIKCYKDIYKNVNSCYIFFLKFYSSGFTCRSMIHFELSLVSGMKCGLRIIFSCMDEQLSKHYLLKRLSFLHQTVYAHLLLVDWPYLCRSISAFPILIHWSICLSLVQYHTVLLMVDL